MRLFALLAMGVLLAATIPAQSEEAAPWIDKETRARIKEELLKRFGEAQRFRIERGVDRAADLWNAADGTKDEFAALCQQYFIGDNASLDANFKRIEFYSEVIGGYFGEMRRDLHLYLDLDWGEIMPIDMAMASLNPAAHLSDDLFRSKVAFFVVLNFPRYSLDEMSMSCPSWDRRQWAYARMGAQITSRIPADVSQKASAIMTKAHAYVSDYNICMGSLVDGKMKTYFPADMKLISHWGIRDELKARYADPEGFYKQQMIQKVMERIIQQEIPEKVVNSSKYQWDPFANRVYENGKPVEGPPEPETRYATFNSVYEAMRMYDPYDPMYPNHIARVFQAGSEIPEKDVEAMFVELLSSRQVRPVADLIRKRLGRKLQPFDIWYPGFKGSAGIPEEQLDKAVAKKYPTIEAFEEDIPNILVKLGFSEESAAFIAPKIQVDPARGSGHAAGAPMRRFKSRLRTRVPAGGMNYKGYNIAMHELGHTVEQTLSLHKVDYLSLTGVPNTAFTEAFAFVFQERDLEILGVKQEIPNNRELQTLDTFWNAYEIMGVALVDMKVWHWMYDHPEAGPAELKQAVISAAKEVWNSYYAPVFGVRDQDILAIYSHMIDYALYLPSYPLGHLIQFQLEDYLRYKPIGPEMERMCSAGNVLPQVWMKNAVGTEISVKPLLQATDAALKVVRY
ncbi:MAG: hypothetical protein AB1714_24760 [Acidobacteriota bacterium]